jgi:hypothetical protein
MMQGDSENRLSRWCGFEVVALRRIVRIALPPKGMELTVNSVTPFAE